MVNECKALGAGRWDVAVVNLRSLPDQEGEGVQVDMAYGSYVVGLGSALGGLSNGKRCVVYGGGLVDEVGSWWLGEWRVRRSFVDGFKSCEMHRMKRC